MHFISFVSSGFLIITLVITACRPPSNSGLLTEIRIPSAEDWKVQGVVLEQGDVWDKKFKGQISPCTVIKKNGIYFLYYVGADGDRSTDGGPRYRALGVATSSDGIHFKKYAKNPIITHLPQNNQEEGIFSAGAALDSAGKVNLYYAAITANNSTTEEVASHIAFAHSADGLTFHDQGYVAKSDDKTVWGYGDEIGPLGVYAGRESHSVYYVAKGKGVFWDLGLATFTKAGLTYSRAVLPLGLNVIGGCDPVLIGNNHVALFVLRDFSRRLIEVRTAPVEALHELSQPVASYQFPDLTHFTIFYDTEQGVWFMYYLNETFDKILLRTSGDLKTSTSPVQTFRNVSSAPPPSLLMPLWSDGTLAFPLVLRLGCGTQKILGAIRRMSGRL